MMKKFLGLLFILIGFSTAYAGPFFSGGVGGGAAVLVYTVATLPAGPPDGTVYAVTDGANASDCTVGAGVFVNLCVYDTGGAAYVIVGDGAGSGNSFSTHDAPAGTDPVAAGAGTLTWAVGQGITITGDSVADSMTVAAVTATTTAVGSLETATDAEAVAVTATDKIVTPSNLDNVLAAPPAIGGTTPAAITGTAVTGTSFVIGAADINEAELEIIDGSTVTTTELNQLATVGATTISANQWAALGGAPETLTGTELGYSDGVTSAIQTQLDAKEGTLTNEAGLYAALSDVARFYEPADNDPTWGTADTDDATVVVYGDGAANGGKVDLYNSAAEDGTDEYWRIEANGENLNIGPTNALTAFVLNRDGSINKSATPKIILDDTDGADGFIDLNATDAVDAVMAIGVDDSTGDDITYVELDGVNETVEAKKPFSAPSIDGGTKYLVVTADLNLETTYPNVCEVDLYVGAVGTVTITAWADPECISGASRVVRIQNRSTAQEVRFDPNGTDTIIHVGTTFTAGNYITSNSKGEYMTFKGYDNGADRWYTWNYDSAANWTQQP